MQDSDTIAIAARQSKDLAIIAERLKSIADAVGWVAVWTFCIAIGSCSGGGL